jgi:cellulose synthase/poly-beta-1,6-N-acetylglucosamine synthase-like glycosyltransferase
MDNPHTCAVIVPAYNKAPYVNQTLSNLSKLTKEGYETVIVDDASTDGTKEIIQEYVAKHPELKALFMAENGKKIGAQKLALNYLPQNIETIIMLDSDSFIKNPEAIPQAIQKLNEDKKLAGGVFKLEPEGKGLLKHLQDAEYAIGQGFRKWTSKKGKIRCAAGAGSIYNRKHLENALEEHSGEFLGDDFELTTIIQDKGYKMQTFPEVKVGTYVPETWKDKVKQLSGWIDGSWRVWHSKRKELGKQIAKPNRFAVMLALDFTFPVALGYTVGSFVQSVRNLDFSYAYLTGTAAWTALNAAIAAYGGADKKTIAKAAAYTQLAVPIAITMYLPATIHAAGKTISRKLKRATWEASPRDRLNQFYINNRHATNRI